jgi:hypothetical protein
MEKNQNVSRSSVSKELSPEQQQFVSKWSLSALVLGPIYFWANGLIVEGFLYFVPFYNIYLIFKGLVRGRKMAWEKGEWIDFAHYEKRQRILGKVSLVYFIAIILFFVATFGISVIALYEGLKGPNEAVNKFTSEIIAGNVNQAYNEDTTQGFKSTGSPDEFKSFLDQNNVIGGKFSFNSWSRVNDITTVTGTLSDSAGNSQPVEITLVKVNSVWKVSSFSLK